MYKYSIAIVSDADSWIEPYLKILENNLRKAGHFVNRFHYFDCHNSYDFVFLLSYSKIVSKEFLQKNRHNLVVHESDLPQGKGWSPLTWQILEGKESFPITLFEADEQVDAGRIYLQQMMHFNGTELVDELRKIQGEATIELCCRFIDEYPQILRRARNQQGKESFYSRRQPNDSELDIYKPIYEQINLLRVADNDKYPAYFIYKKNKYVLKIEKDN